MRVAPPLRGSLGAAEAATEKASTASAKATAAISKLLNLFFPNWKVNQVLAIIRQLTRIWQAGGERNLLTNEPFCQTVLWRQ